MRRRRFFETLTAALLAVLMIGSGLALAAPPEGKGPNKDKSDGGDDGGTTDPVLPPIEYDITYFDLPADADVRPTFNQMNNLGQCVGYYNSKVDGKQHPWLYDPFDPDSPNVAIELNSIGAELPAGYEDWVISSAVGINDFGDIVGYISVDGDATFRRGYLLRRFIEDTSEGPVERAVVDLLPDDNPDWADTYARRINNNGDILGAFQRVDDGTWGVYIYNPNVDDEPQIIGSASGGISLSGAAATDLNNPYDGRPAQIVGTTTEYVPFVHTRGFGTQYLTPEVGQQKKYAQHINDLGVVAGSLEQEVEEPLRGNKTHMVWKRYLFRDDGSTHVFEETEGDLAKDVPLSINLDGSILVPGKRTWIDYETSYVHENYIFIALNNLGFVDIAPLVNHPDPSRIDVHRMNSFSVHGFGQLYGTEKIPLGDGTWRETHFLLTPTDTTP